VLDLNNDDPKVRAERRLKLLYAAATQGAAETLKCSSNAAVGNRSSSSRRSCA
jgi:hypothetical protein